MSRHDDPPLDNAPGSSFDAALSQHFRSEPEPDDDGFSQRVMVGLPARASRRPIRWLELVQRAQWMATSVAACSAASLMSINDWRAADANTIAACTLIGLLIFWSIPSRWSRG
jgi:hypothetical protein